MEDDILICDRRMMIEGEDRDYILCYRLIPHRGETGCDPDCYYGIQVEEYVIRGLRENDSILSIRRADLSKIKGLSEDIEEAKSFLNMIAEGVVFPVSLDEIYDDWMSAFHPRWKAIT